MRYFGLDVHKEFIQVCAIDDVWSGLRFCWRTEHRDGVRAGRRPVPALRSGGG